MKVTNKVTCGNKTFRFQTKDRQKTILIMVVLNASDNCCGPLRVLKQSLYYITIIHSRLKNNYIKMIQVSNILNFFMKQIQCFETSDHLISDLKQIPNSIKLPNGWYFHYDEVALSYFCIKNEKTDIIKATVEKQVIINFEESQITSYIKDKLITEDVLGINKIAFSHNISQIQHLVDVMNSTYVCIGGPSVTNYPGSY